MAVACAFLAVKEAVVVVVVAEEVALVVVVATVVVQVRNSAVAADCVAVVRRPSHIAYRRQVSEKS